MASTLIITALDVDELQLLIYQTRVKILRFWIRASKIQPLSPTMEDLELRLIFNEDEYVRRSVVV